MTASRSRTALLYHPSLLIGGSSVSISKSIRLLGFTLDNKLTFEEKLQTMAAVICQKAGLLRKCRSTLGNGDAVLKHFLLSSYQVLSIVCLFGCLRPVLT